MGLVLHASALIDLMHLQLIFECIIKGKKEKPYKIYEAVSTTGCQELQI